MRRIVGGLVLLLLATHGLAAGPDIQTPVDLPGGVTDADGKVGYFTSPKGGIVAVDLEKGTVLWDSKAVNKPLVAANKRLIGLVGVKDKANAIRVVTLDTEAKGKLVSESDMLTLPDWVTAGEGRDVPNVAGKSFVTHGHFEDGSLLLVYRASSRYYGGARPTEEILKAAMKDKAGEFRVDLKSGKIKELPGEPKPSMIVLTKIDMLPKEAQETAKREGWQSAWVKGPRAYGRVEKMEGKPMGFGGTQVLIVQAIDLQTSRLLWERPYEERRILPPPP
ncbi:MAG: hypothetical protein K2R98_25975 [Gemmataceae bacterium]|nr:hypothetical protein [Gemmataceae bacterium]